MVVEVPYPDSSSCTRLLQAWVFLVFYLKALIEQTSARVENVAQVEQIDKQIASIKCCPRAEQTIKKTETSAQVQTQIYKHKLIKNKNELILSR